MYRELQIVRCEASLEAFKQSDLFETIPQLQRDALMVYDHLKKTCYRTGSTYMDRTALCEALIKNVGISNDEQAWLALQFLREQNVVVFVKEKVVLKNFHFYEKSIAESLSTLLDHRPWKIPVDAREILYTAAEERQRKKMQSTENDTAPSGEDSPPVDEPENIPSTSSESSEEQADPDTASIVLDEDHVQAVKMICDNPVTIISGKAGCGKTTVVSTLFKAVVPYISCEEPGIQKDHKDNMNDTLGSEDPEETLTIRREEEILLTAPTGRAASLLKKKTSFKAYTLHQVLDCVLVSQTVCLHKT